MSEFNKEQPLLEVRNLKKYFKVGKKSFLHAVDDVSFRVYKGKTLGVVGESGCGKSTLGRTVLRLLEPTAGEILLDEKDITKLSEKEMGKLRSDMQIIFQDPYSSLNPRMTVSDLIAEYMIVAQKYPTKEEIKAKTYEMMDLVGLDRRFALSYPHELDGGRRQRIGIARALSLEPKFIVCDEPVSALDVSIQAQILNLLIDLQQKLDLTYIFITHNLAVVRYISNDIMVMYLGECVEFGSTEKLFANPSHPYTKALLSALLVPALETHDKELDLIRGEVSNPVDPKPGCRFAARCAYACDRCHQETPPLRDIEEGHQVACWLYSDK